jgi:hypothetical protein
MVTIVLARSIFIKHKSNVEFVFLEFQKRVELLLNTKIKSF